jgi:peptide/nickel transport system substrate-binding protein
VTAGPMSQSPVRWVAAPFICLALAGCSGDVPPTGSAESGGTLVISVSGDPETLLPPLSSSVTSQVIGDLVYDRLAEIGDSLNTVGDQGFQPRLASSWEWSPDSLSIAFHLDPEARWHDGLPVRATDVAFTWQVYTDPANGSPFAASLESVDSVSIGDSLTAVFWFSERSPMQFYDAVNTMSILPAHALQNVKGPALRTTSVARAPVGSGRFRFARWDAAQSLELHADTANYRGRPGFDRVFMTIAPDGSTALKRLLGGEADVIEQVPATSLKDVESDTTMRVTLMPGLDYNFLQFNLRDPRRREREHPLFGDRELRRALTMALDRRSIVRNAYGSLGDVALGPTVRAYPTTDRSLRQIPFAPDSARRTLDSLGWKDSNGDGVRDRNGVKLEFSLAVPASSKSRNTMAALIQEQMRQVGIKVNIDRLDFAAFIDRETRRNFDAVLNGWHVEPSPGGIRQTWGSAGARAASGSNYGAYVNPVFDSQVDSALSAATLDARRAQFTKAYQTIIDDAPAIWLAEPKGNIAIHRRIRTVGLRPDAWWANLAEWTIPPSERIARDRALPGR